MDKLTALLNDISAGKRKLSLADIAAAHTEMRNQYDKALKHLRAVTGSRNSFTPEVNDRLFRCEPPITQLRNTEVERMHRAAVEFLNSVGWE